MGQCVHKQQQPPPYNDFFTGKTYDRRLAVYVKFYNKLSLEFNLIKVPTPPESRRQECARTLYLLHDGPVLVGASPKGGDRVAGIAVPLRLVLLLRQPIPGPVPLGTTTCIQASTKPIGIYISTYIRTAKPEPNKKGAEQERETEEAAARGVRGRRGGDDGQPGKPAGWGGEVKFDSAILSFVFLFVVRGALQL